jgi:hypothetical protein
MQTAGYCLKTKLTAIHLTIRAVCKVETRKTLNLSQQMKALNSKNPVLLAIGGLLLPPFGVTVTMIASNNLGFDYYPLRLFSCTLMELVATVCLLTAVISFLISTYLCLKIPATERRVIWGSVAVGWVISFFAGFFYANNYIVRY